MGESPVEALRRWEDHGATWRIAQLSETLAILDLCTCYGEPVDRLESSDPELIRYVSAATAED